MKRPLLFFAFIAFSFFTTLVSAQPVNDNCGSATTLTSGTPQAGTVLAATASGAPVGCAVGNPDDDVWYKFTTGAGTPVATISLPVSERSLLLQAPCFSYIREPPVSGFRRLRNGAIAHWSQVVLQQLLLILSEFIHMPPVH
jgi:hypothetical protein